MQPAPPGYVREVQPPMSDNAETAGPLPADGSAESVRRVRALAGDLVARPLDEPAAERLAAVLGDLGGDDRAALRRLASQRRGSVAARPTDSGRDQSIPDTPSQSSGSYRPLAEPLTEQGAHRR